MDCTVVNTGAYGKVFDVDTVLYLGGFSCGRYVFLT